jgi:hypothetical protein
MWSHMMHGWQAKMLSLDYTDYTDKPAEENKEKETETETEAEVEAEKTTGKVERGVARLAQMLKRRRDAGGKGVHGYYRPSN